MKTYAIAWLFFLGSFLLGEFYPFTKFPMYNSFPNYAYVFYLTDKDGRFIPLNTLKTHGGAFSHMYFSIANQLNIHNGFGKESKEELAQIGKRMVHLLEIQSKMQLNNIEIHRVHFYHTISGIIKQDRVIYAIP